MIAMTKTINYIMDIAGKNRGVNYFEDRKADMVGEETINVFAFSSLVFITTSIFLSSTLHALPSIILISVYEILHDNAHRWFPSLPLAGNITELKVDGKRQQ